MSHHSDRDDRLEWIRAYQEAQRQLAETHRSFQSSMSELHTSFLRIMEASFDGLNRMMAKGFEDESLTAAGPESVPVRTEKDRIEAEPETVKAETSRAESETLGAEPETIGEEPETIWKEPGGLETESEAFMTETQDRVSDLSGEETDELIAETARSASATPAAERTVFASALKRCSLQEAPAPRIGLALAGLAGTSQVAVTDDGSGIAPALVEQLQARGVNAAVSAEGHPEEAAGLIFLGGLSPASTPAEALEIGRTAFGLARSAAPRFTTGRGFFVTVQDTGGDFGLSGQAGKRAALGALAGLARSVVREWPAVTAKAIDFERGEQPPWKIAKGLAEELLTGGPEIAVGLHADGERTTLEHVRSRLVTTASPEDETAPLLERLGEGVVLVCGGPSAAARGGDGEEAGGQAYLEELGQTGVNVFQVPADTADAAALSAAVDEARETWGTIRGVIHGPPPLVPASSRRGDLLEKSDSDFEAGFIRRVGGLLNVLAATADDPLAFLFVLSRSAALGEGRSVEETMAEEALAKIAAAEQRKRGGDCVVKVVAREDWSEASDKRDGEEERGGSPALVGRHLLEEIRAGASESVEIVIGATPKDLDDDPDRSPMLTMDAFVGAATHPYLEGHRPGHGAPLLPLSLILEWFSRIARAHCPDLEMMACHDLVELRRSWLGGFYESGDAFTVVSQQRRRGAGRELLLELYAQDGSLRASGRAEMARPGAMSAASSETLRLLRGSRDEKLEPWPFSRLYGLTLFQGSEMQTVRMIQGLDGDHLVAGLIGTREMGWHDCWRTDIAALDGGLQLALLWYQYRAGADARPALPVAVKTYYRHFSGLVEGSIHAVMEGRASGDQKVECDIVFANENGTLLAELRGVEVRPAEDVALLMARDSQAEPTLAVELDTDESAPDDSAQNEDLPIEALFMDQAPPPED